MEVKKNIEIVCICGRKSSGKSTVAKPFIDAGYIKISFADSLKEYISKIYDIDIKSFYSEYEKGKIFDVPLLWTITETSKLNKLSGENIPHYRDYRFNNIREAMQIIGTDIIKKYCIDFHINHTLSKLEEGKKYCIDDCRFLNEKYALEKYNTEFIFIYRPNNFDYSNHISEIELNWSMFDITINNNSTQEKLLKRIKNYIKYKNNKIIDRKKLSELLRDNYYNTTVVAKKLNCSRDKIVWWCERLLIEIEKKKYHYNNTKFLTFDEKTAYFAGLLSADGCIKRNGKSASYVLELSSNDRILVDGYKNFLESDKPIHKKLLKNDKINYTFSCNSQYIIENIKLWEILPRKSRLNKIPSIIKNNRKLLNAWLMGLIDGDGCIYVSKNGSLEINILASEEIIDFVINEYQNIPFKKTNEKGVENLFKIRVSCKNAYRFYKEIYNDGYGLERKWEKINHIKYKYDSNT